MTSKECRDRREQLIQGSECRALWEIAAQLALMNEGNGKATADGEEDE
jgi:hypothetical protein